MGYFLKSNTLSRKDVTEDPFGNIIRSTGDAADDNPFRFSTKYHDDETGLVYYGYRFYDPVFGRWLSRDPIKENGGLNLYGFVRNSSVCSWDFLGLFGSGKMYNGVYFAGHSDFFGNDIFNYNLEDDAWDSNPFTPWGMHRHFRSRLAVKRALSDSVPECDKDLTERLLHQLQDTFVHWAGGWRWWKLGHAFARIPPDLDNDAWQDAAFRTGIWVDTWLEICCRAKAASDGWIRKDGSEGCCDKEEN